MDLGVLNKVLEVKALKKVGEDEALRILQKVAKQVQPIMRKRRWKVKILSEFCPTNPSLLGINVGRGVHVKLRLRKPNRDSDFFPYDQILDTMLHELCHITHGPHNAHFYKLWDDIRKECEELMAKGVTGTGQGFDAPGIRLGGFSSQPSLSSLQKIALAAAEKRARLGVLLPSGPKRLGGDDNIMAALSPIQAAAMAAERRFQDDLWCGSESYGVSNGVESDDCVLGQRVSMGSAGSSKGSIVSETDNSKVIPRKKACVSCDSYNAEIAVNDSFSHSSNARSKSSSGDRFMSASTSGSLLNNHRETDDIEDRAIWECSICTLFNQPLAPICEACGTQKPKDAEDKFKIWSCRFCTLENNVKLEKCSACDQWRYSYGAPVSIHGPNVGT